MGNWAQKGDAKNGGKYCSERCRRRCRDVGRGELCRETGPERAGRGVESSRRFEKKKRTLDGCSRRATGRGGRPESGGVAAGAVDSAGRGRRSQGNGCGPGAGRIPGIESGTPPCFSGLAGEPGPIGASRAQRWTRTATAHRTVPGSRRDGQKKKRIAAPEFRVWSPTTLLGQALSSLTTVDRTGNGAFC